MSDGEINGASKKGAQCQHQRLLERVPDQQGNKTDMMKCCECGAVVFKPAQKARSS
jgi:hypothetical protein